MKISIHPNIFYWPLLMLILLGLGSCGFHPRGQTNAPAPSLSPLMLTGLPSHHAFYRELTHQLQLAGVSLTTEPQIASTLLKIHEQKTSRRMLSVDSRNKTVEYEIEESLEYSIQHPSDTVVVEHQSLSANRILFNPGNRVLGRDREETLLREDMHKQLSRLLLNRLSAIR